MSKGRILIIEDDIDISNMLRIYFNGEGYAVEVTSLGSDGITASQQQIPDLIILDIMLPDTDGYDVYKEIRKYPETKKTPIIFLTQKDRRSEQLTGLDLGARDYITKPFDIKELKLRVTNILNTRKYDSVLNRVSFKGRLLIVEDDMDIATILHTYFTEEGFQVEFVVNGQDALEVCQQKLYDLIVLDVQLPDMDGYDVCQQLRASIRTANTPIIFLTQRVQRRDRLKGLELGADDYITKPFDIDELHLRIRNLIDQTTHLPIDLETAMPAPKIVEEELNGLHHYTGWVVFLVQLKYPEDVMQAAALLTQTAVRFAGRWAESEFILILDKATAKQEYARLKSADISLLVGGISEENVETPMNAYDIIATARSVLA